MALNSVMLDWLSSWLFVKRFRMVLASAQSSLKSPLLRTLTAFPCEQFVCHSRGPYFLLFLGQCHKYAHPKRYDALSEINHSLRGIIGLAPLIDLIVDHSVVYCCLIKLCLRPQHDTLHLSIS